MLQLESKHEGAGLWAMVMPESEVIAYYRRMKNILESPETHNRILQANPSPRKAIKRCPPHKNTINGSKGSYCVDCEKYI